MSEENVKIVRRAKDLLRESYDNGGATDSLLELCAPDIRVDATHRVFNPDIYEGKAGVQRAIREVCDTWESFSESDEQLIDAGDRVLVIQTISGRGRTSKAHVEQKGAITWTVKGRLVHLIEIFTDPNDALKTVARDD